MLNPNITSHMIVKNEERWVWYSIKSVIDHVESMIIYDTGSTDETVSIIKSIPSKKIILKQFPSVTAERMVELRNQQIQETKTNWFMLVDGDEVWPNRSIVELTKVVRKYNRSHIGIVVQANVPVGDLYHLLDERAGNYSLMGMTGHYNLRGYKIVEGMKWIGSFPLEAYVDKKGKVIQDMDESLVLLKHKYWHLTHMRRSSLDHHGKRKVEVGNKHGFRLPEVFFMDRPAIVPSPWSTFTMKEEMFAKLVTPLVKMKRLLEIS